MRRPRTGKPEPKPSKYSKSPYESLRRRPWQKSDGSAAAFVDEENTIYDDLARAREIRSEIIGTVRDLRSRFFENAPAHAVFGPKS